MIKFSIVHNFNKANIQNRQADIDEIKWTKGKFNESSSTSMHSKNSNGFGFNPK